MSLFNKCIVTSVSLFALMQLPSALAAPPTVLCPCEEISSTQAITDFFVGRTPECLKISPGLAVRDIGSAPLLILTAQSGSNASCNVQVGEDVQTTPITSKEASVCNKNIREFCQGL